MLILVDTKAISILQQFAALPHEMLSMSTMRLLTCTSQPRLKGKNFYCLYNGKPIM